MTFTWSQNFALCAINYLGDPDLVLYLLNIVKRSRRDYVEDEARLFHISLRTCKGERWERLNILCQREEYSKMNSLVPITCKLPFDDHMWSNSERLLKDIQYFRLGFMKKENEDQLVIGNHIENHIEQTHQEKVRVINRAHLINSRNMRFMGPYTLRDIRLAYSDFIVRIDNINDEDMPYLFTCVVGGLDCFDILN